jgi:hypothetical protein
MSIVQMHIWTIWQFDTTASINEGYAVEQDMQRIANRILFDTQTHTGRAGPIQIDLQASSISVAKVRAAPTLCQRQAAKPQLHKKFAFQQGPSSKPQYNIIQL